MSAKAALCVLASLALATSAQAAATARVETVSGSVMAIQAKGASPAQSGMTLVKGDRLVARGGEARLRYADGCVVSLKAGSMATIAAASPCAGGAGVVTTQPANAQAVSDVFNHLDAGTVAAGLGTLALVSAVVVGLVNPDKRCNPNTQGDCNADGTISQ